MLLGLRGAISITVHYGDFAHVPLHFKGAGKSLFQHQRLTGQKLLEVPILIRNQNLSAQQIHEFVLWIIFERQLCRFCLIRSDKELIMIEFPSLMFRSAR